MDINITLFFQMLVFVIFIGITMKYIWPSVTQALDTRQKKPSPMVWLLQRKVSVV